MKKLFLSAIGLVFLSSCGDNDKTKDEEAFNEKSRSAKHEFASTGDNDVQPRPTKRTNRSEKKASPSITEKFGRIARNSLSEKFPIEKPDIYEVTEGKDGKRVYVTWPNHQFGKKPRTHGPGGSEFQLRVIINKDTEKIEVTLLPN